MELFRLFGSIFVDNEKANQSIHKTEEKAEGLGSKMLKGIGTAAKWSAGIAGAAFGAVGGMVALASKTGEAADFIDKLSERTGINREELQRWKYAADQSGADVGKLEVGIKKLSAAMIAAEEGSEKSAASFAALGISMDDVMNSDPSEVFEKVMKGLAEMPDSAARNVIGNDLLGKSYSDMLPLLNAGAAGIDELKNRADELGLVMSEESVKANVKFGDTLADVKNSLGAVVNNLVTAFLPVLQMVLDFVLKHMPEIQTVISAVFGVVTAVVNTVIEVIKEVAKYFEKFFDNTTEEGKAFQEEAKKQFEWLSGLFDSVKEIVLLLWNFIKTAWEEHGDKVIAVTKFLFDIIKTVISTVLDVIKGIIKVFTSLLKGDWEGVWNGLKEIVLSVLNGLKELLPKLFNGLVDVIKYIGPKFLEAGKNLFTALWDGIKNVWSSITKWVGEKISWLTDKLQFWKSGKDKMQSDGSGKADGSHANGLSYVPFDGYKAILHKGERVLTANENKAYSKGSGEINNNFNISSLIVREEADIKKIAKELHNMQKSERRATGSVYAFS